MSNKCNDLNHIIKQTIANTKLSFEVGYVFSVQDGIAVVNGLPHIMFEEVVIFENGLRGMVVNIETDRISVLILGETEKIISGMEVTPTGKFFTVQASANMIGQVFNGFGELLSYSDEKAINPMDRLIEHKAPAMFDRQEIKEQIITGIRMIDWLAPIAKGQRTMIIGDKFVGKTTLVVDMIINLKSTPIIAIYVSIGQRKDSSMRVWQTLLKYEVKNIIMLVANASDSLAMRYMIPFVATSMSEYFRDLGMHAIVFFDDLNEHAVSYREMSLLLKRPPGREAYPGDIFYLHSRLLERFTRLNDELGGGSSTAVPVVKINDNELADYIGTNILSIVDGQWVLDSNEAKKGRFPAINTGLSVSRIGVGMQCKALRKLCATLKLDLAKYEEYKKLTQFSSDISDDIKKILDFGDLINLILCQKAHKPDPLWKQLIMLYAVVNKHVTSSEQIRVLEDNLVNYEHLHEQIQAEFNDPTTPTIFKIFNPE